MDQTDSTSAATAPTPTDTIEFGGLHIAFDDRVLRPRAWTIAQSEWAAELLEDAADGPVLELFAGVGHIGLAGLTGSDRDLVLVDLNPVACVLARQNVDAAGLAARVEVREGRIDDVLEDTETFPLIIADPPWVPSAGIHEFPEDPHIAIDGGSDGLDLARTACQVIDRHLEPGGSAIVQLGSVEQAETIGEHLVNVLGSDIRVVETRQYDRGVLARLTR
ncbi:methyltransferase [Aeromicrobium chenweiae]|uniref:Methyltransferase n=1 Tax=Aeromicrobium chenweiae TaxID=2079793 RepID=A0A2S0WIF7_9ACTN|nr:class I SAM-dependent methyltransferase [Aeromicrobium chenweiae]AWB91113.1 methyltransferase [Aeromicrobium chenweiae]TGN31632.1 class I SAM-dependent methyltransferase [Aeromicrobium chenweiae]